MTGIQRAKLQRACALVAGRLREKVPAEAIIAELVRDHGARFDPKWDAARLRCCGVSSSCTWSKDKGLLDNWRKTATVRLMESA